MVKVSSWSPQDTSPPQPAIKTHEFFKGLVWEDLLSKTTKPPFKSKSSDETDTNNFHKAFTTQKPMDSVVNAGVLNEEQQANFDGFTYVPQNGALAGAGEAMGELDLADGSNEGGMMM